MKINYILQPEGSNLCGQTCVAMVANVSIEEAIEAVGKHGLTNTRHLINGLRRLGIDCDKKLLPVRRATFPPLCIAKVRFKDSWKFHWIVLHHGVRYDPQGFHLPSDARITSYLKIN